MCIDSPQLSRKEDSNAIYETKWVGCVMESVNHRFFLLTNLLLGQSLLTSTITSQQRGKHSISKLVLQQVNQNLLFLSLSWMLTMILYLFFSLSHFFLFSPLIVLISLSSFFLLQYLINFLSSFLPYIFLNLLFILYYSIYSLLYFLFSRLLFFCCYNSFHHFCIVLHGLKYFLFLFSYLACWFLFPYAYNILGSISIFLCLLIVCIFLLFVSFHWR